MLYLKKRINFKEGFVAVRGMDTVREGTTGSSSLLRSVAEELKLPLMQIAREAELRKNTGQGVDYLDRLQTSADMALMLVDSYLLGLELSDAQAQLELEPISVSSVLTDTAHSLSPFAKQYDVLLEMQSSGKYGPVMAHGAGLKAALLSLGYALVSVPSNNTGQRHIMLGLHQSNHGLVAGVYGDFETLAHAQLRQAQLLCGRARQPFRALSGGSAAGVFVADMIFRAMHSSLGVSRHHKQTGLAATLQPSRQLVLV